MLEKLRIILIPDFITHKHNHYSSILSIILSKACSTAGDDGFTTFLVRNCRTHRLNSLWYYPIPQLLVFFSTMTLCETGSLPGAHDSCCRSFEQYKIVWLDYIPLKSQSLLDTKWSSPVRDTREAEEIWHHSGKKSRGGSNYVGEGCEGKRKLRFVGFSNSQQEKLQFKEQKRSIIELQNCQIKKSIRTLWQVLTSSTKIPPSTKQFDVSPLEYNDEKPRGSQET